MGSLDLSIPSPITIKASDGDPFTILQFNANGIGNKQVELSDFLERHTVNVAVIQESKLTLNSRTPNIQNFTTVRKDRDQGQGGGLLTLIHKSINFSRRPDSPDTLADPHLEELTITVKLGNTDLIITWISLDIARFYKEHCQPSTRSACLKNGNRAPLSGGGRGRHNLHRVYQTAVTDTPHVGCVVWSHN